MSAAPEIAPALAVPLDNSTLAASVLDLKAEAAHEFLDIASTHLIWTARHLADRRFDKALTSYDRFARATQVVTGEIEAIRGALADRAASTEAAVTFRRERDSRRR